VALFGHGPPALSNHLLDLSHRDTYASRQALAVIACPIATRYGQQITRAAGADDGREESVMKLGAFVGGDDREASMTSSEDSLDRYRRDVERHLGDKLVLLEEETFER
jgi:hypothetical protein